MTIVAAAFFGSGGLNAGTPFDTASTPVMAVQPFENAVSSRNSVSGSLAGITASAVVTGATVPVSACHRPAPMSDSRQTTKK